jgi:MFS family permease
MTATGQPLQPPRTAQPLLVLLVALGVVAFLYGITQPRAPQVWGMYLVNLLFWSSLAITGPALAGAIQLTEGRWSPTVKRVALTTAGFLPFSFALFVVLLAFGLKPLYPWVADPSLVESKKQWLNVPFFVLRIGIGVALLYWLAMRFTRAVWERDRGGAESEEVRHRLKEWAGTMLIAYVVVLSLWGFDLLMSLDPRWYSGLFGGYYVVTSLYTGFGLVCFLTILYNTRGVTAVPPANVQDVAKLVFAMCIMWMYFFFSQYLVIWYGNVPVETRFFLRRFFVDPWRTLAFVIFIVGALIPFAYLLGRLTARPSPRYRALVVILFMGWIAVFLERIMIVFPSMSRDNTLPLGVVEFLITAGFFSLFVLSRRWFIARYRPVLHYEK